jgi:Zn ribbon nucleic-acid-binding protein|tara:strand:- start:117 stop:602 length:486 start_codon:yes stop_codon:yes gene_type:complete
MKIISNCALCEEHSLHVIETDDTTMMQCLFCGYATSNKLVGDKEINAEYHKLPDDMKRWSKEKDGQVWIPGILTLPEGMIYPIDIDGHMSWAYADIKPIPLDEREKFNDSTGTVYEVFYDVDNAVIYKKFYECLLELNIKVRENRLKDSQIKLPKLKKING